MTTGEVIFIILLCAIGFAGILWMICDIASDVKQCIKKKPKNKTDYPYLPFGLVTKHFGWSYEYDEKRHRWGYVIWYVSDYPGNIDCGKPCVIDRLKRASRSEADEICKKLENTYFGVENYTIYRKEYLTKDDIIEPSDVTIEELLFSNKERKMKIEKFTRDDLSVGHVVQMRNGEYGMVFPAGAKGTLIVIFKNRDWEYLSHWTTDLRSRDTFVAMNFCGTNIERRAEEKDIVAVYGHIQPTCFYANCGDLSKDNRPVLWTRVDPKKMTVSEISEALGYPVEVVAEE